MARKLKDISIDENILKNLSRFIEINYEPEIDKYYEASLDEIIIAGSVAEELVYLINNLELSFSEKLFQIIDAKGIEDPLVYKKANIDRRLFSKMRNTKNYKPRKKTVLALALALELNLEETNDLLNRAEYSLSMSNISDVIIQYFIILKKYDIHEINLYLHEYEQELF